MGISKAFLRDFMVIWSTDKKLRSPQQVYQSTETYIMHKDIMLQLDLYLM